MTAINKIWNAVENINWLNVAVWILFPVLFWGVLIWVLVCAADG